MSTNQPTINDHYRHDHERLDALFGSFQKLKSADRPAALQHFAEFRSGLQQHIAWEEDILFPSFEEKTGMRRGPTEVMRWEHREIRKHLEAIAEKLGGGEGDTAKEEAELASVLSAHNLKEEHMLYPMIDQVTGDEERAVIFSRMETDN